MVSFKVVEISFYDVLLDFVLLDAFDDLATPPYTVATAVQNRWLSARIKETVSDNKNSGLSVFMHFFLTGVCIVHIFVQKKKACALYCSCHPTEQNSPGNETVDKEPHSCLQVLLK